jgi:hypothetical protein
MELHFHLTDKAFEEQFASASLSPNLFTHEAHIRLAWIHITRYGEAQAISNICAQLQYYVQCLGAADKYNHTLTVAAVKAVAHFIKRCNHPVFIPFMEASPRLKYNFKDLMLAHYHTDIFHDAIAKKIFLEPELLPFD